MQLASNRVLIGCRKIPTLCALIIPLLAIASLLYTRTKKRTFSITLFSLLHVLFFAVGYLTTSHTSIISVPCNAGLVHLIYRNGITVLIDPGYIAQHKNPALYIQYKLLPEMIKQTGRTTIDHCIILQPHDQLSDIIVLFCQLITVQAWYIVRSVDQKQEDSFFHTSIIPIENNSITIPITLHDYLTISPLATYISYRTTSYPAVKVAGSIDKNLVNFYSAKYRVNRTRKENYDR